MLLGKTHPTVRRPHPSGGRATAQPEAEAPMVRGTTFAGRISPPDLIGYLATILHAWDVVRERKCFLTAMN